jgi:hypothetical protein
MIEKEKSKGRWNPNLIERLIGAILLVFGLFWLVPALFTFSISSSFGILGIQTAASISNANPTDLCLDCTAVIYRYSYVLDNETHEFETFNVLTRSQKLDYVYDGRIQLWYLPFAPEEHLIGNPWNELIPHSFGVAIGLLGLGLAWALLHGKISFNKPKTAIMTNRGAA